MKMHHKHKLHFMHIHCEIRCSECELNLCVPIEWLLRILKNCLFASHVKLISNYSKYILNISPSMWLSCKSANFLIYLLLLKVYVHYPSGKKTALITSEVHRSICRTIVGGNNVERTIVNNLCSSHPEEVTNGAAKMIKKEALALCKRGSGSILQSKDFKDFFEFKWQQMKEELQRRCPTILSLLSAVVSDQELSSDSKSVIHVMVSAAIALHGRNQEMSLFQYMIAFVLTHGGCIQRVWLLTMLYIAYVHNSVAKQIQVQAINFCLQESKAKKNLSYCLLPYVNFSTNQTWYNLPSGGWGLYNRGPMV